MLSFPNSTEQVTLRGGKNGIALATDIEGVSTYGHYTRYAGDQPLVALALPLEGNKVPEHRVLHQGVCGEEEQFSD